MTFCTNCGLSLEGAGRFCPSCGVERGPSAAGVAAPAEPSAAAGPTPAPRPLTAAPAPPAPAAREPSAATEPAGATDEKRRPRRRLPPVALVAVVAVGLVALGAAFARGVTGRSGGADSPEQAVEQLAAAVSANDVLGVISNVDPDEVGALAGVWERVVAKAEEVGIGDLAPGRKTHASVERLRLSASMVGSDVARVRVLDGAVTVGYDGGSESLPDAVSGGKQDETADIDDLRDGHRFLMAVRKDGRWFVSVLYTVAEHLRVLYDLRSASFGSVDAKGAGAASPTDAVRGIVEAVNDADPEAGVKLLSRVHTGAIHDYVDSLLDAPTNSSRYNSSSGTVPRNAERTLRDELAEAHDEFGWRVENVRFGEEDLGGGRVKVLLTGGRVEWTTGSGDVSVEWDEHCVTVDDTDDDPEDLCLEDWPALRTAFPGKPFVVVREVDGRWYLDPMDTLTTYAETIIDNATPEIITGLLARYRVGRRTPIEVGGRVDVHLPDPLAGGLLTFPVKAGTWYTVASGAVGETIVDVDGDGVQRVGSYASASVFRADKDGVADVLVHRRDDEGLWQRSGNDDSSTVTVQVSQLDLDALPVVRDGGMIEMALTPEQPVRVVRLQLAEPAVLASSPSGRTVLAVKPDGEWPDDLVPGSYLVAVTATQPGGDAAAVVRIRSAVPVGVWGPATSSYGSTWFHFDEDGTARSMSWYSSSSPTESDFTSSRSSSSSGTWTYADGVVTVTAPGRMSGRILGDSLTLAPDGSTTSDIPLRRVR